jgi:hypothetical protein
VLSGCESSVGASFLQSLALISHYLTKKYTAEYAYRPLSLFSRCQSSVGASVSGCECWFHQLGGHCDHSTVLGFGISFLSVQKWAEGRWLSTC